MLKAVQPSHNAKLSLPARCPGQEYNSSHTPHIYPLLHLPSSKAPLASQNPASQALAPTQSARSLHSHVSIARSKSGTLTGNRIPTHSRIEARPLDLGRRQHAAHGLIEAAARAARGDVGQAGDAARVQPRVQEAERGLALGEAQRVEQRDDGGEGGRCGAGGEGVSCG